MPWDIAVQFGLLGCVLFAIGYALWKAACWFAPKADQIIDAHLQFVSNSEARMNRMDENVEQINGRLTNLETVAAQQTSILSRLSCHQNGKPQP